MCLQGGFNSLESFQKSFAEDLNVDAEEKNTDITEFSGKSL